MKKLIVVAVGMVMAVGVFAETWTDPKTGLSWTYQIVGDSVSVGGGGYSSPALPTSTSGAIDIPPEINGTNVTMIGAYAFSFCNKLTSVTIPSCVTSIGEWSFAACSGMTNVSMSGGVTDIGFFAFGSCDGLTCITIPASVLHIGNEVFEGCGELVSIDVDGDNPNYKSENGLLLTKDGKTLFQGVNGVVTVPAGVMDINNYAFASLDGLTRIMIPSSVTNVARQQISSATGAVRSMLASTFL